MIYKLNKIISSGTVLDILHIIKKDFVQCNGIGLGSFPSNFINKLFPFKRILSYLLSFVISVVRFFIVSVSFLSMISWTFFHFFSFEFFKLIYIKFYFLFFLFFW